jgi:hypothetical protein
MSELAPGASVCTKESFKFMHSMLCQHILDKI